VVSIERIPDEILNAWPDCLRLTLIQATVSSGEYFA
jgi:hypothetical protein